MFRLVINAEQQIEDIEAARKKTYWTVQHAVSFVAPFLDVTFQCTRVKRLQQLEAAKKLAGNRHDGSPVVELSTVLPKTVSSCHQEYALAGNSHWVLRIR